MNSTDSSEYPGINNEAESKFIIVGIGASAGGIMALKAFFEQVPADSGMAYVVILHLSPDHDSKLAEIISVVATIPVSQVLTHVKVEPNRIYVIPPNQHLEMNDGTIAVSPNMQVEDRRAPVDIFFRTLAESHGAHAVCVVLSGTGANGSMGLKRIKERGGAAFAQNPREAEFNEMPRNSIATDLVDEILPVAEIPARIILYNKNLAAVHVPVPAEVESKPKEQLNALKDVFKELRIRTGHDFSDYKRPTLLRRVERRISLRNMPNLQDYVSLLQRNPDETVALLKDLLISVTNFFRDKKAFQALEQDVIPVILKRKSAGEQVRIWVAGCATGEEAYSIAMLCSEQTTDVLDAPKIQIFGTDIDEAAIANARDGFYTLNDAADVSPERLRRFFNKEGEGYRVRREIREMVLFANHNFIKDPPFSHLDLVSCRNVLIYLNRSAQERVMETFHFALEPNGFLFVGTSESVDAGGTLYESVNRDYHIFKSRPVAQRTYPVPETVPVFSTEQHFSQAKEKLPSLQERFSFGDLHQHLLEQYAPPSLVINQEFDIVHLSEHAGQYLQFAAGEPSQNLLKVIRPELRLELRSALYQALQEKTSIEVKEMQLRLANHIEIINVHIKPVLDHGDVAKGFILVIFEKTDLISGDKEVILRSDESVSRHLEDELTRVKSQLRGSNEQHEFQAEELKASNEELQAVNEELRSAAEELETSKEELQSMNEELRTVNQELKVKIEETSLNSNNLQNLINSTSIGTIFLDRSFRIAMFTPSIRDIFNLIPADYGRPLSDITHKLEYHELLHDAEKVMEKLGIVEHEVATIDNRFFLMRLLPYRTSEDHINGVVITFIDISKRKDAEQSLRQSQAIYRTVLSSIDEGFCVLEMLIDDNGKAYDAKCLDANDAFFKQAGLPKAVVGNTLLNYTPEIAFGDFQLFAGVALTGKPVRFEFESGKPLFKTWFEAYAMRINEPGKKQVAIFYNNITEHKYRELNAAFLVKVNDDFNTYASSPELIQTVIARIKTFYQISSVDFIEVNEGKNSIIQLNESPHPASERSSDSQNLSTHIPKEWLAILRAGEIVAVNDATRDPNIDSVTDNSTGRKTGAYLMAAVARNGRLIFIVTAFNSDPHLWRKDEIELLRELAPRVYQNLERIKAAEELRLSDERLKKAFSIETVGVIFFKPEGQITDANAAFLQMGGYTQEELNKGLIHWNDLTDEATLPQWLMIVEEFLSFGRTLPYEKELIRKDGSRLWVLVSITRISQTEAVEFIIDITEQKLLQQQKDEFIAIASHELKTPVTSIKVYAEVLQETFEKANDHKNAELIGKLDGQLNRLAKLITDLLDTTKISEGQLILRPEEFDLNALISERVEELQRISPQHRIVFNPGELRLVNADKERINQVLINLIANAVKYSQVEEEIVILTESTADGAMVSIRDKGIGIPAAVVGNVFERFFRVGSPKIQTYPGMGLGLYISAAIIRRHGGTINVESKEGDGSLFYFILPYEIQILK